MAKLLILSSFIILTFSHSLFAQAKWTFMVYLDADNNLEEYGIEDFNEMEEIGSTDDVNIIVQMDRIPGEDNSNGDWTDTRRFRIIKDSNSYSMTSPLLENLGEVNMGDPNSLVEFVNWSMTNYPAQHYCLVFWDHGNGWRRTHASNAVSVRKRDKSMLNCFSLTSKNSAKDKIIDYYKIRTRSICFDDTDGDFLSNNEIAEALQLIGTNIDIIGYDACLMGMFENAYEIRGLADFMIGSEEEEPSEGWAYNLLLEPLVTNPVMSPFEFSQIIVDKYGEFYNGNYGNYQTLSSLDLSAVNETLTAINNFATAIIDDNDSWTEVRDALLVTDNYSELEHIDLYDFAEKLQAIVLNDTIKNAANDVRTAVSNLVIRNYTEIPHENANGVAIYFPPEIKYSPDYTSPATAIDFPVDSQWDELLNAYYDNNDFGGAGNDIYEPNDSFGEAYGPIEFNVDYEGYLFDGFDVDLFKIEALYTLDSLNVQLFVPADFDLYFYDSTGTELEYSDNGGIESENILLENLPAGVYYIEVSPWNVSLQPYTLIANYNHQQTSINNVLQNFPKAFDLFQNYPNPCNSSTRIEFYLSEHSKVEIAIFSVNGQRIRTLLSQLQQAGTHRIMWNGRDDSGDIVSSGVYYYTLTANDATRITRKLLFIK